MNCQMCKNAIFNALWGEYKCGLTGECEYQKGTPRESKENEEYNLLREDGK